MDKTLIETVKIEAMQMARYMEQAPPRYLNPTHFDSVSTNFVDKTKLHADEKHRIAG